MSKQNYVNAGDLRRIIQTFKLEHCFISMDYFDLDSENPKQPVIIFKDYNNTTLCEINIVTGDFVFKSTLHDFYRNYLCRRYYDYKNSSDEDDNE